MLRTAYKNRSHTVGKLRPGNYTQALEKYLSSSDFKDSIYRNAQGNLVLLLYASGSYAIRSTTSTVSEPDDFIVLTLLTYSGSGGSFDLIFEMHKRGFADQLRKDLNQSIKENVAGS
jgi:hypothetical protein